MHHGSSAHGKAMYWNLRDKPQSDANLPLPPVIGPLYYPLSQSLNPLLLAFLHLLEFRIHWLITEPFKLESMEDG